MCIVVLYFYSCQMHTLTVLVNNDNADILLFQFATDRDVFLFDILELPPECFEEGIKAILENPDVLKVSRIMVAWHGDRW